MSNTVDAYSATLTTSWTMNSGDRVGTNFTGTGYSITNCTMTCGKISGATGNAVIKLWATTGALNSTLVPTGAALATSDNVDVATGLSTTAAVITFTFSGANIISPTSSTQYCWSVEFSGTGQIFARRSNVSTALYDMVDYNTNAVGAWTNDSASGAFPFTLYGPDVFKASMLAFF